MLLATAWQPPRCHPGGHMAVSFEEALEQAPSLCRSLHEELNEDTASLTALLTTSAGARGFFVHWLTGDEYTRADRTPPPPVLVEVLTSSPTEVAEVMIMNVIMSAASAVHHKRAGRAEQAESSERTCARAMLLVRAVCSRISNPDIWS